MLGTERHESRRIDNQLRGRSGRQGDMGSSRFYLSMEDDLLRIFGAERISSIMDKVGLEEDQPIEHRMISKAIENAQKRVEGQNFDMRKHLLEFDNVMNKQRQVIYEQRRNVLGGENLWSDAQDMLEEIVEGMLPEFVDEKTHPEEWNLRGLDDALYKQFSVKFGFSRYGGDELSPEIIKEQVIEGVKKLWAMKEEEFGKPAMDYLLKYIMLQSIDTQWKDHLLGMDHLKEGIGLRGYGQKDPIREYQKEGYEMFSALVERIKSDSIEKLCMVRVQKDEELEEQRRNTEDFIMSHGTSGAAPETVKREGKKVGRNDPCPCGSGKKYKKCCGK